MLVSVPCWGALSNFIHHNRPQPLSQIPNPHLAVSFQFASFQIPNPHLAVSFQSCHIYKLFKFHSPVSLSKYPKMRYATAVPLLAPAQFSKPHLTERKWIVCAFVVFSFYVLVTILWRIYWESYIESFANLQHESNYFQILCYNVGSPH